MKAWQPFKLHLYDASCLDEKLMDELFELDVLLFNIVGGF